MKTESMIKERGILMCAEMVRQTLTGAKTQTRRVVRPDPWEVIPPKSGEPKWPYGFKFYKGSTTSGDQFKMECPYGAPGDRLYLKEAAWMWCERRPSGITEGGRQKWLYVPLREAAVFYCADHAEKPTLSVVSLNTGNQWGWRKKVGRFLPRWASRITLEIVSVRVERVQEISEADILEEGARYRITEDGRLLLSLTPQPNPSSYWPEKWNELKTRPDLKYQLLRGEFAALWDSINAKRDGGIYAWDRNPWVWVVEFRKV